MASARGLRTAPLTRDRWQDLADLFGPSGAYSGCWCMFLRGTSAEFEANCRNGGAGNRRRFQRIVQSGAEPGLLAYRDDRAVGWISVGPREHYPRVLRSPVHRPVDDVTGVWSIACFFIAADERGQGVADVLLDAAIRFAQSHGARCIEAYPLDAGDARRPTATLWRGLLSQFEKAGFEVIARRKPARPIVRRSLCDLHCSLQGKLRAESE